MFKVYYASQIRKALLAMQIGMEEVSTTGVKRLLRF